MVRRVCGCASGARAAPAGRSCSSPASARTWTCRTPGARLVGDRELIAFDPPGAGLWPRPRLPLRMSGLARVVCPRSSTRLRSSAWTCSDTRSAARSPRSWTMVRRTVFAGPCCAPPRPASGGSPPRPLAAVMLASPIRYYARDCWAGRPPSCQGADGARARALGEQAAERLIISRGACMATPTSSPRSPAGPGLPCAPAGDAHEPRRRQRECVERSAARRPDAPPRACPTRACTSLRAAGACFSSTSRRTSST